MLGCYPHYTESVWTLLNSHAFDQSFLWGYRDTISLRGPAGTKLKVTPGLCPKKMYLPRAPNYCSY